MYLVRCVRCNYIIISRGAKATISDIIAHNQNSHKNELELPDIYPFIYSSKDFRVRRLKPADYYVLKNMIEIKGFWKAYENARRFVKALRK